MSKKTNKSNNTEVVKNTKKNAELDTLKVNDDVIIEEKDIKESAKLYIDEKYLKEGKLLTIKEFGLNNMSLFDLVQLEKACALLCKRFETSARIDRENNDKFKEYKVYYEKIFSELENRVSNVFKI